MTQEDQELDPSALDGPELTLYRIAKTEFANLSGVGAALFPGRWNKYGQEALYTSTEIGTAVLERLAHTPKDVMPENLSLMTIRFRRTHAESVSLFTSLRVATKTFENFLQPTGRTCAVAVPSVVVPAWNVVLYPHAHGFWKFVSLLRIDPFTFDPRLF